MSEISVYTVDEERLKTLAASLAPQCKTGDCLLLIGELGAGKTSFARAFIHALQQSESEEVVSPTFTLVQTYQTKAAPVAHFDLYRIKHAQELQEIGLDDALQQGITLIEWPQIAQNWLPAASLTVSIGFVTNGNERSITLSSPDSSWCHRVPQPREVA